MKVLKLQYAIALLFATFLIVGCSKEGISQQPESQTQVATPVASTVTGSVQSGTFQTAEKPTQGTVRILTENGKKYLEFDNNFQTENGPDLFVILHRNDQLPVTGIKEKDYVSIARLQTTNGAQRFEIPENIDLGQFKSVAIWCKKFNTTFGYAPLSV